MKVFCQILFNTVFFLSIQAYSQQVGNGRVIKKTHQISNFKRIDIKGDWDLKLTPGPRISMIIECDNNLHDYLVTESSNHTLKIRQTTSIKKSTKRIIHLTFIELNSLTASGSSDIDFLGKFKSDRFDLNISRSCDLTNLDLQADIVDLQVSGSSDIEVNNL